MKTKPFLLLLWGLIAATVLNADVTLLTNDDSLLIPDVSCRTEGKVIKVTDGDTINVLDAEKETYKIRLAGIDAPERKQAYGKAATKFLAKLVNQKTVCVDWHKRDRYGRLVGVIHYEGRDVDALKETIAAKDALIKAQEKSLADYQTRLAKSDNLLTDQREKLDRVIEQATPTPEPKRKGILRRLFG